MNQNTDRRNLPGRTAALAAAALLTVLISCGGSAPEPAAESSKVVIIALDGVSWNTAAPLVERGEMPHLASLVSNGCWGSLDTLKPTWTPIIFTTMATGKSPEEHGVNNFIDANGTPLSSNMRRVKALWNMVSEASRKVVFVGWPVTWPAEEVNGVLVAENFGMHEENRIHPPELQPELARRLAVLERNDPHPDVKRLLKITRKAIKDLSGAALKGGKAGQAARPQKTRDTEQPARRKKKDKTRLKGLHVNQVMEYIRTRLRLEKEVSAPYFIELVAREAPDLAVVYFAGTDMLQHTCGARDNQSAQGVQPNPEMLSAIDEVHRFYDAIVGELQEGISALPGYEDCIFIVLSDHGFDLDAGDQPFALRRRQPVEGSPLYPAGAGTGGTAADAVVPLPQYLVGESLLPDTPAESPGDLHQTSIFESIEPGSGENQGWWLCRFDPRLDGPARYQALNRMVHYGESGLESRNLFTTIAHDFQPPGIFVIQGGQVQAAGPLGDLAVDQIAPTVLALMGMAVADDMPGGPIPLPLTLADGAPALLTPPSRVTTYDTVAREADEEAVSSGSDEKIRNQLRLMGYIE